MSYAPTVSAGQVIVALDPITRQIPRRHEDRIWVSLTKPEWDFLNRLYGEAMGDLEAQDEVFQDARRARLDEGVDL